MQLEHVVPKTLELRQIEIAEHVVILGGTGFVGRHLKACFEKLGYSVVIVGRNSSGDVAPWDGESLGGWANTFEGATAVINLSGEPIAQNWNSKTMPRIIDSRVNSTSVIGKAIQRCDKPPKVWINASAVGIYGDRSDTVLEETSEFGVRNDFLVKTCVLWEHAQERANTVGTAKCAVRLGIILGKDGGALPPLIKLTQAFLGGGVGSGKQFVSWIHIEDVCNLMAWIVQNRSSGVYCGTAPNPVTNGELMSKLRGALGRPWVPNVPKLALKLAHFANGPHPNVLLYSQRVVPNRAIREGFVFRFNSLEEAIANLIV